MLALLQAWKYLYKFECKRIFDVWSYYFSTWSVWQGNVLIQDPGSWILDPGSEHYVGRHFMWKISKTKHYLGKVMFWSRIQDPGSAPLPQLIKPSQHGRGWLPGQAWQFIQSTKLPFCPDTLGSFCFVHMLWAMSHTFAFCLPFLIYKVKTMRL